MNSVPPNAFVLEDFLMKRCLGTMVGTESSKWTSTTGPRATSWPPIGGAPTTAYDVWLTKTSEGVPEGQYDPGEGGAFLMVWTFDPANKRPRGPGDEPQFSAMTVPGVSGKWDVWVDDSEPPCISYVATQPVDDLGFDLKHFIDDSVQNSYGVTSEMYLSVVFAGFEVWAGGDGLQVEEFCVDVQ